MASSRFCLSMRRLVGAHQLKTSRNVATSRCLSRTTLVFVFNTFAYLSFSIEPLKRVQIYDTINKEKKAKLNR